MMILKKNRSKPDIVAGILNVAQEPVYKTKLMYSVYISTSQSKLYLSELLEKELLSYDADKRTFLITNQGKKYLKLHNSMKRLC